MKLEAISAYSVQSEVSKTVVSKETQTTELLSSSPQNFEDDVVSLSVTNTNLSSGDSVDHNGHGKHPPSESEYQVANNDRSKSEKALQTQQSTSSSQSLGTGLEIQLNGNGKHPPE